MIAVVGFAVYIVISIFMLPGDDEVSKIIRENTILRKQLEAEKVRVTEYRWQLATERDLFGKQIDKSIARYDSLDNVLRKNAISHQKEIARLKKSTLKQLEDEAEFLYRSHSPDSIN